MARTHRDPQVTRAALYHRVSSEEQVEGYSLDAQQRAGRAYAEAHGWVVTREYRDEGKSARTDDLTRRPAFSEMLADAERGLFDIIVVHKLDRFSRNLRVTLETLDRLNVYGVAFVSINENMDFSTPIGKVILATLGAFGQFYSDNLSFETKKGKAERKRQGMYNGLLPFGVKKNDDGLPVPDPDTYPGLLIAFKLAVDGTSDRDIAGALNAAGYRTTGNRGRNLFTKDTVRHILINRFFLGELPDGDGWIPGKHAPMLDAALFDAAQRARELNRTNRVTIGRHATTYSLSGLATCAHCGGRIHIHRTGAGRARVYCYTRTQAGKCAQRSTFLDTYEAQIAEYLTSFRVPGGYREQILAMYRDAKDERGDTASRRVQIDARLDRIKQLFEWGDLDQADYVRDRDVLTRERDGLRDDGDTASVIEQCAAFLMDLPSAWEAANQEQRNKLARLMLETVEVRNNKVEAIVPRPDFAPFFILDCQDQDEMSTLRKRRDSNPRSRP